MMLKSFSTNGGKGVLAPAVSGRFDTYADRSTSENESTPAMPAVHRIANSLVLNFIRRSLRDSPGGPTGELTRASASDNLKSKKQVEKHATEPRVQRIVGPQLVIVCDRDSKTPQNKRKRYDTCGRRRVCDNLNS